MYLVAVQQFPEAMAVPHQCQPGRDHLPQPQRLGNAALGVCSANTEGVEELLVYLVAVQWRYAGAFYLCVIHVGHLWNESHNRFGPISEILHEILTKVLSYM